MSVTSCFLNRNQPTKNLITLVLIVFCLVPALFLTGSCRHELLPGQTEVDLCDSTNVSFQKTVLPLLIQNCSRCHSSSIHTHDIILDDYPHVRAFAKEGSLYGSVLQNGEYAPMPYDAPKLDDCTIAIIRNWVKEGIKDN